MSNDMEAVAVELEALSSEGAELHSASSRATVNHYSDADRALRAFDLSEEYFDLQTNVATGGLAAVVTAGVPGSGKSTAIAKEGFGGDTWREIDADVVKELILHRELERGTYSDLLALQLADGGPIRPLELASLLHRESSAVTENILREALRRGENVVLQTTLAWSDQPEKLLGLFGRAGYGDLTILDIEVDVSTAKGRSRNRWWSGRWDTSKPLGGRFVPESLIDGLYLPNQKTKCNANATFMFEIADLERSRLITSATEGGVESRVERIKYQMEEVFDAEGGADADVPDSANRNL